MKPRAKVRKKGERPDDRPPSQADEDMLAATQAAARVLVDQFKVQPLNAERMVGCAMVAFMGTLGFRAVNNPELKKAMAAEEPWSLMRLIDKDEAEEAAIAAALPVVAEVAATIDPTGEKPFGQYGKRDVERLLEAAIAVWEDAKGNPRVRQPGQVVEDTEIPF